MSLPQASTLPVEYTGAHITVYICHHQLQLHPHQPGFFFWFDVNMICDGSISSETIKAESKLNLRVILAAGCGACVCVCVQRLASAGLLTRGYRGLKGLKCQDFAGSRSTLSALILAAGETK